MRSSLKVLSLVSFLFVAACGSQNSDQNEPNLPKKNKFENIHLVVEGAPSLTLRAAGVQCIPITISSRDSDGKITPVPDSVLVAFQSNMTYRAATATPDCKGDYLDSIELKEGESQLELYLTVRLFSPLGNQTVSVTARALSELDPELSAIDVTAWNVFVHSPVPDSVELALMTNPPPLTPNCFPVHVRFRSQQFYTALSSEKDVTVNVSVMGGDFKAYSDSACEVALKGYVEPPAKNLYFMEVTRMIYVKSESMNTQSEIHIEVPEQKLEGGILLQVNRKFDGDCGVFVGLPDFTKVNEVKIEKTCKEARDF